MFVFVYICSFLKIIQEKVKPIHRLDITANFRLSKWRVLVIVVTTGRGYSGLTIIQS